MNDIYNTAQVRELDRVAIEEHGIPGLTLMKRAAQACVTELLAHWPVPGRVGVLCGSGNNAGDGFIVAGLLRSRGIDVHCALVGREPAAGTDAHNAFLFMQESGVRILGADEVTDHADLIVDALLGTGITGEVRPAYRAVIEHVATRSVPVLSVDLPSGLDADTGTVRSACIRADVTVTLIGMKIGLVTGDGPEYAGRIRFAGLEVPEAVYDGVPVTARTLDYHTLAARLPRRHRNAHKRSHGHLVIAGGGKGMAGAVAMTGEAALYSGAGLVTVVTHEDNVPAVVTRRPELMAASVAGTGELASLLERATAVVLGPGLGQTDWGRMLFDAVLASEKPVVIDADGLNFLATTTGLSPRDNWILTPHPGEASRLLGGGVDIQADRVGSLRKLHERYGGHILLKGAGSLVASPGQVPGLCPCGNPGMSVGGMGDVLSGVIGALLVQGTSHELAIALGTVVHSLAADQIVKGQGERGLLATELLPVIRRLLNPGS